MFFGRVHPLVEAAQVMNTAIKTHDPALWEQIKGASPSEAWDRICAAYGFERVAEQGVSSAARMVIAHFQGAK